MAKRFGMRRKIATSMSVGRFVAPSTNIRSFDDVRPSHKLIYPRTKHDKVSDQICIQARYSKIKNKTKGAEKRKRTS